jgi:hypothetical protein
MQTEDYGWHSICGSGSLHSISIEYIRKKKSELIIEEVDLKNNCIYATAKNQLYDADDNYIIYGVSNYLKGNLQLSYLKEGESILVISNGKVLLSDPYQFDKIYSIQLLQ